MQNLLKLKILTNIFTLNLIYYTNSRSLSNMKKHSQSTAALKTTANKVVLPWSRSSSLEQRELGQIMKTKKWYRKISRDDSGKADMSKNTKFYMYFFKL